MVGCCNIVCFYFWNENKATNKTKSMKERGKYPKSGPTYGHNSNNKKPCNKYNNNKKKMICQLIKIVYEYDCLKTRIYLMVFTKKEQLQKIWVCWHTQTHTQICNQLKNKVHKIEIGVIAYRLRSQNQNQIFLYLHIVFLI